MCSNGFPWPSGHTSNGKPWFVVTATLIDLKRHTTRKGRNEKQNHHDQHGLEFLSTSPVRASRVQRVTWPPLIGPEKGKREFENVDVSADVWNAKATSESTCCEYSKLDVEKLPKELATKETKLWSHPQVGTATKGSALSKLTEDRSRGVREKNAPAVTDPQMPPTMHARVCAPSNGRSEKTLEAQVGAPSEDRERPRRTIFRLAEAPIPKGLGR